MTNITQQLAQFSSTLRFVDLPPEVVERTKNLVLDLSGIIVRAQSLDSTLSLKEGLQALDLDAGQIRIWGESKSWRPQAAALIAGAAAHSLDFDDTHAAAQLHPGAPVISAALVAAQMVGATTQQCLAAIVAGYEVMVRVALGVNALKHGEHGFHGSATVGVFGATAAAGNLLALNTEQMEHAFGTALSESAGTGQFAVNGAWTKRFHVGNAAAGGVLAATLARHGFTGATQAFEGKDGFFNVYSPQPHPEKALQGLGSVWEILNTGVKPYPCCRGIHAPLDAVLALKKRHSVSIEAIESVRVGIAKRSVQVVGEPQERRRKPKNVVDCQFSTHLCLAVALKHGHLGWNDYEPALQDADIFALMQKIHVFEDPECEANFPTAFSGVVEIVLRDGQKLREFVYAPQGEPDSMPTAEEAHSKFSLLVHEVLGQDDEDKLFNAINSMHEDKSIISLFG